MQQQQHSHVATVATATKSHSHQLIDKSFLTPARSELAGGELGARTADGATAGADELSLPSAGRPSMEADALLPDLPRSPPEEEEWGPGANACLGAKACCGANTGPSTPEAAVFLPVTGLSSADALSTEAAPLLSSILPALPDEEDWGPPVAGAGAEAAAGLSAARLVSFAFGALQL